LVQFDPEGNLRVSELFVAGASRRIVTTNANSVSEETVRPNTKAVREELGIDELT
jgi:hypothetical protein